MVIVEDHGLMAQSLRVALEAAGFAVEVIDVGVVIDVPQAVRDAVPDVVLLDLDLGEALDATAILPSIRDVAPVVMVTGVTDDVRLARCIREGAVGIVAKSRPVADLLDAVTDVLATGTLLDRHEREEHLALLRRHEAEQRDRLAPFERLTPREAAVLRELCEGRSVDRIARDSVVSVATVRTQVRAILAKLGVGSQLAATALARQSGWYRGDA